MHQETASFTLSRAHRLWRRFPAEWRRTTLAHATAWLAPRPDREPPAVAHHGLIVAGELSRASGLGEVARLILGVAPALGVPAWGIDLSPAVDRRAELPARQSGSFPPGAPLLVNVNGPQLPLALLRLPRSLVAGRRIVGYWAWELPVVPPEWRIGCRFVHEIWAPSRFAAAALETLMPGRVRVVAPPLAAAPIATAPLDRAAFGLPPDALVVMMSFNLASSFSRKNPIAGIAAFRAAFGERPDRILVLKVSHPEHAPDDFVRLAAAAQAPNIRLETRVLPSADNYALMAASDIVLSLHRSEGFGLVPAEAMLLGKPVVATAWSGNMDFMDGSSAALVGCRLVPADDPRKVYRNALWAEPDVGEAADHLRRLAQDPAARKAMGMRGQSHARERLGAASLARALRHLGLGAEASPAVASA